jgi:Tfp pilus assembly protein PilW
MNNKELYKLLKKNNFNSNSGFTLIELLIGLMMSIFVIGALGFGLMTVLATSQSESSKVKARTENSRALDFISDEMRRAKTIETSTTGAGRSFTSAETPVLVLNIPEISSTGKVVYYLQSNSGTNWKGPQVLYRWGPPLQNDGSYGTGGVSTWDNEALIDGINSTPIATSELDTSCPTATRTRTPAIPSGFYACLVRQDATKAYQPDKTLANYNPSNTAQLFLTGQTKTASGVNYDSQTNDTQVVARARETMANKLDENTSINWNVEGLGGDYLCKIGKSWDMRTDFSNSATPSTDTNKVSWTQVPGGPPQQPQPIEIKSNQPLTITSNPINATGCDSSSASISHTINFGNPTTFNGVCDANLGPGTCPTPNKPRVQGDSIETVQFIKKGYQIPTRDDGSNYGTNDLGQYTLGRFLYNKGWAIPVSTTANLDARTTNFKIPSSQTEIDTYVDSLPGLDAAQKAARKKEFKVLEENQRIVGFEVGVHADTSKPGFDLQDNIFVVTSDVFKQKFAPSCFSGTLCKPNTGKP